MTDGPDEAGKDATEEPDVARRISAIAVLAALGVGVVFAIVGVYPHRIPVPRNPSFVDDIFLSRIVLLSVRIAVMFAAGYVVVSVVGLILGRRWLSELGPFKASDPIARLERGAEAVQADLQDALTTIEDLEGRLLASDQRLAEANGHIGALLGHIDRIEARKERK